MAGAARTQFSSMVLHLLFLEEDQQGHPPTLTGPAVPLASLRTNGTTSSSSRIAQDKDLCPGVTFVAWKLSHSSTAKGGLKTCRGERLAEPPQAWLRRFFRSVSVPISIKLSA